MGGCVGRCARIERWCSKVKLGAVCMVGGVGDSHFDVEALIVNMDSIIL